jgi:hypothetical protein
MSSSTVSFPCASLGAALPQVRRPPSVEAVRFKIQNIDAAAGQVATYVDARFVYDRLDLVCGERWWPCCDQLPEPAVPSPVGGRRRPPTGPPLPRRRARTGAHRGVRELGGGVRALFYCVTA